MKKFYLLLALFIYFTVSYSQEYDDIKVKIDSLFISWNTPNHPGGSIAVSHKGELIYHKAFGLASLEYLVPNTPGTIYNTASVSKQFTSMGIIKLHQQGKLNIDDDIREHLPDLPDFGEIITIRHLMHHTSGLRSLHAMLALAGWRGDDLRTNDDLYRFVKDQKELNFKPGSNYAYCNTGYMLMSDIIEKVTNEKFTDWIKAEIFEPLGMHNTYVEDEYDRIVPNNATSYYGSGPSYSRAVEYWDYIGSGNMHSTTADLIKWLQNFHHPRPEWVPHFQMLQTLDNFNDGYPNNYAFGVNIGSNKGYRTISHGGAIGGFRSTIISYPDSELDIAILTNFSSSSVGRKSQSIADIVLKDKNIKGDSQKFSSPKVVTLNISDLTKLEGHYWQEQENFSRKIYVKNDTLRYFRSMDNESALLPISKTEFLMVGQSPDIRVIFNTKSSPATMTFTSDSERPSVFYGYIPEAPNADELNSYTGTFYSPELKTMYTISSQSEGLKWYHTRHGWGDAKRIKKDILSADWPMNVIKYERDISGNITGIRISNGRVQNLWMKKIIHP